MAPTDGRVARPEWRWGCSRKHRIGTKLQQTQDQNWTIANTGLKLSGTEAVATTADISLSKTHSNPKPT